MFRGVFNYAASSAGSLIAGYLARASVAVPFIVAFGFAMAALSLMLSDRFGHLDAYLIVAGTFTVLGLFAALIVRGKERAEVAEEKPLNTETSDVGADGTNRGRRDAVCYSGDDIDYPRTGTLPQRSQCLCSKSASPTRAWGGGCSCLAEICRRNPSRK